MLEHSNRERLRERICRILQGMNFLHKNFSYSNSNSDVMVLNTDMLGLRAVGIILDEMNNTLTIQKNYSDNLWIPILVIRSLNHVTSLTPLVAIMYSASVVDKAPIDCIDASQEIALTDRVKM